MHNQTTFKENCELATPGKTVSIWPDRPEKKQRCETTNIDLSADRWRDERPLPGLVPFRRHIERPYVVVTREEYDKMKFKRQDVVDA